MKRNNDRMLLESLVRKYGKNTIKQHITAISEEYVSGVDNIWLCVDANGSEKMFSNKDPYAKGPQKSRKSWQYKYANMTYLPSGTIKKLIGYDLTWEDDPVEYSHK